MHKITKSIIHSIFTIYITAVTQTPYIKSLCVYPFHSVLTATDTHTHIHTQYKISVKLLDSLSLSIQFIREHACKLENIPCGLLMYKNFTNTQKYTPVRNAVWKILTYTTSTQNSIIGILLMHLDNHTRVNL